VRTQIKYTAYRDKSLAQRKELGVGNSDEMNTLFRFWCACPAPATVIRIQSIDANLMRVTSKMVRSIHAA